MFKCITICFPLFVFSQFSENFSDGDFTTNPSWLGQVDSFIIDTNFTLQLSAPANTSSSYLSTASSASVNGYWEFFVQLDFNPSNSNKALVYLMSNDSILTESTAGYYVLIGTSNDEVSLYRQDANSNTKLIDGLDDLIDKSEVKIKVRVDRDLQGNFTLNVDTTSSFSNYINQGNAFDNSYFSSNYFGVVCDYTASRSDKFWFDDIEVSAQSYVDSFPPRLDSFYIEDLKNIKLYFSETIDSANASLLSAYHLNSVINPVAAAVQNTTVSLRFAQDFFNANSLQINVSDIMNNNLDTTLLFSISNAAYNAAIINEIYADPTPSFGMPNNEFIELRNTSNDTLFLSNWKIADATDTVDIPIDTLLPNGFVILCNTSASLAYSAYGKTIAVPNMPSLNNSGDALKLLSAYNSIIDTVSYSNAWYHDEVDSLGNEKKSGGYSLERLFQQALCSPLFNWYPSLASVGATPGGENSRTSLNFSPNEISILEINIENDTTIQLKLDGEAQQLSTQNVVIGNLNIEQAFVNAPNELTIALANPLDFGTLYYIDLVDLTDCFGNTIANVRDSFLLYEPAQASDLVINEILFNPISGGVDFLEVFNRTDKAIEVTNFQILEYQVDEPTIPSEDVLIEKLRFEANSYIVFARDTAQLTSLHYIANPNWLKEYNLPNFSDNENIIVIQQENGLLFDSIIYNKRWHFELLDIQDGVSLERIDANTGSLDKSNWHSAAKTYNYATPTAANSQQFNLDNTPMISIEPQVFSPNSDGYKDFCLISYKNETQGNVLNLSVYDVKGRKVKDLALNELLGSTNTWKWNGTNNNFEKAPVGIYILVFELFNPTGKSKIIKKTVVLGTDLN